MFNETKVKFDLFKRLLDHQTNESSGLRPELTIPTRGKGQDFRDDCGGAPSNGRTLNGKYPCPMTCSAKRDWAIYGRKLRCRLRGLFREPNYPHRKLYAVTQSPPQATHARHRPHLGLVFGRKLLLRHNTPMHAVRQCDHTRRVRPSTELQYEARSVEPRSLATTSMKDNLNDSSQVWRLRRTNLGPMTAWPLQ